MLQSLRDQAELFDFRVFQNINENKKAESDMSNYSIFQRFCLMLLVINGGSEAYNTSEFLKDLNVYNQIKSID